MKYTLQKKNKGFTLVELLIVISIISMLSSVVLANLQDSRALARDARRVQDLSAIRSAMGLYLIDNFTYPFEKEVAVSGADNAHWTDCSRSASFSNQNAGTGVAEGGILGQLIPHMLPALPEDPAQTDSGTCIMVAVATGWSCGPDQGGVNIIYAFTGETKQSLPYLNVSGTDWDEDGSPFRHPVYCLST